jgi:hypothetical protein
MKKRLALFIFFTLFGSFSVVAADDMSEAIGTLRWTDPFMTTYSKLEQLFGNAARNESTGIITAIGTFAGEPAAIQCDYAGLIYMTRLVFTVETSGTGNEAYIGYEKSYSTLQELYGSPSSIDIFTGERIWLFNDGSKITLRTFRTENEASRKTKGTLSGQGSIKGQSRTLGRDGGRTDADYLLDLNPAYNADGLVWDGEESYTLLKIKTIITFSRPLTAEQQKEADEAPPPAPAAEAAQ